MIDVNSRYIYLRELRNKKSSTRAMAAERIDPEKEQLKKQIAAQWKELEQLQREALEFMNEEDTLSDSSME